ncbi:MULTISPECIES: hypothetical protein [unclassified Arthrobacter]|uniref:hypothetical protein n=1 Tax=unclassified Arthrobacter TaxID=235627 RepID=UPI001E58C03F|nr:MULTISPECIES: hypothetical protein [unclassified Arthrobacter]MCC9144860.1 hypothetical protein [Arthrobacter sp. zg-Y919]MDK1276086.1 hypothetical protein [Arthrobacter sp. zg.Y919]WIB02572.1 hypothetical protein QNO10_11480 [Arthrobacter sp. zg-Y919]
MEQDSERDFLGRQYGPASSESSGQYVPPETTVAGSGSGNGASGPQDPNIAGPNVTGPHGRDPVDSGAMPAVGTAETPDAPVRQLQVGTVVWGLVLTTLAVLLLLVNTVNLSVDPVLLVLGVTLGAGLALLVGGLVSGAQRGRSH